MSAFKIDGKEYESRRDDLQKMIDHLGPERVLDSYKENPAGTVHGMYQKIWFDRKNQDTHPAFVNGSQTRLFPYQEDYEIYPNNSNDQHLTTMLKRALYEILPEAKMIDKGRTMGSTIKI